MTPYIGQIQPFGFNFPPRGWAQCNGQLLSISQYTALFSLLGTIYGGDGRTTFALPDLRGRTALHMGQGPGLSLHTLGQKGGNETTTLAIANLPAHNHTASLHARAEDGTQPKPAGNLLAGGTTIYGSGAQDATMASDAIGVGNTGSGQNFSNMQPYLVVNWCIALQGIFPPRS